MTPWDAEETRKLVLTLYGPDQLEVVRQCINSIVDRQRYARFHFQEAKAILNAYFDIRLESKTALEIVLLGNEEERDEFEYCQTKIGAHIIGFVQSMHSLGDILANTIYFSLGCNFLFPSLAKSNITLHATQVFLSKKVEFADLSAIMKSILDNEEFKYLAALANHSKHRSLIKPTLWFDTTGKAQDPYTLRFKGFKYKGKNYPDRLVLPFLENEYSHLSKTVIEMGNALNTVLLKIKPL